MKYKNTLSEIYQLYLINAFSTHLDRIVVS